MPWSQTPEQKEAKAKEKDTKNIWKKYGHNADDVAHVVEHYYKHLQELKSEFPTAEAFFYDIHHKAREHQELCKNDINKAEEEVKYIKGFGPTLKFDERDYYFDVLDYGKRNAYLDTNGGPV